MWNYGAERGCRHLRYAALGGRRFADDGVLECFHSGKYPGDWDGKQFENHNVLAKHCMRVRFPSVKISTSFWESCPLLVVWRRIVLRQGGRAAGKIGLGGRSSMVKRS